MHFAVLFALITRVDVNISGSGWTSPDAIRRLVATHEGALLDEEQLQRDLARLRTLGVLYDVSAHTSSEAPPPGEVVTIEAKDRWSLVPVLGLRRGGGRTTARVGVSDRNAFGRLFTVYGELTSNADVPFVAKTSADRIGSYLFTEVPRIFATRFTPFLSWTREFLDFSAFNAAGPGYVYDRARYALRGELRYEATSLLTAMAGFEARRDRYRTSSVSRAAGEPPPSTDTVSALAGIQLGYVEDFVSQQRGQEARAVVEIARTGELTLGLEARGFFVSGPHNFCLQAMWNRTTGTSESFLFRAGGLREIRGFIDAYFAGATFARANVEWRLDVLRANVIVPFIGQIAVFSDSGYVGGRDRAVAGLAYEGPIFSAGAGVRAIPIPFAHAVGRLDFATGLVPKRTIDISFSGQQFF